MLGLIGLSALGKSMSDKHVHRVDWFKNTTGLTASEKIDANAIVALIRHERGLFENCPDAAKTIAFLNQADVLPNLEVGKLIAEQLSQNLSDIPDLVAIGQASKSPAILETYSNFSVKK